MECLNDRVPCIDVVVTSISPPWTRVAIVQIVLACSAVECSELSSKESLSLLLVVELDLDHEFLGLVSERATVQMRYKRDA